MTQLPQPPEKRWPSEGPQIPNPHAPATARAPFSKAAIAGFVISCVGLIVFAAAGLLGAVISVVSLRRIRERGLRGRGLAIAGLIIGVLDFVFYLTAQFLVHP
ncbi:DUF4190 domain-containing protein [Arthrobacter sp. NA-172]|uniref:DUF4190 domain-containing protein n=1 Tax=Arthrobacter sp. NA-172 TaxID=3367524 RepID=UPI003755299A